MKAFFSVVIIFICWLPLSAQTPVVTSPQLNGNIKISSDNNSKKIDSIKKDIIKREENLSQKLIDASNTIDYLNSLVNSFGQIFTILGIFIGIITLALPIIMYQFGIKPSQRALKDLELNIDTRLSTYLKTVREKEIDTAIENIKSGSTEKKNQAITYLSLTHHEGLTDQQFFRIYNILNNNLSQTNIKSQLAFILTTNKNEYAELLFGSEELRKDPTIKYMGYLYFSKTGFTNHRKSLADVINSSENPGLELNTFVTSLSQYSYTDTIEFFNDKELIDLIEASNSFLENDLSAIMSSLNISEQIYNDSYIYQKLYHKGSPIS